jgi:hypothetical protein
VPGIEVVDETVILVRRETLAGVVADRARWSAWWPGLDATVVVDRGVDGLRWQVTGGMVGSAEVALTPVQGGILVRYAFAADPAAPGSRTRPRRLPDSPHGRRELAGLQRRHVLAWKATVWALKDELESGT